MNITQSTLSFFTPVYYPDRGKQAHFLTRFAESYFDYGFTRAVAVNTADRKRRFQVVLENAVHTNTFLTALKIISLAAIIFPLILMGVKLANRVRSSFQIIEKTPPALPGKEEKPIEPPNKGTEMSLEDRPEYCRARQYLKKKQFDKATGSFVDTVALMLEEEEISNQIMQVMHEGIEAYRVLNPHAVADIESTHPEDEVDLYFQTVRHYFDHRTFDQNEIEAEINASIPLSGAEERENIFVEGPATSSFKEVDGFEAGIASAQGPRDEMEDAHLVDSLDLYGDGKARISLFGVFDGHGGSACAQYVQKHLREVIRQEMQKESALTDSAIYHALCRAFVAVSEHWATLPLQSTYLRDNSGSTATAALVINGKELWIANVGDSRAVLGKGGQPVQLSEDQKPTKEPYFSEVFKRGGYIRWGRVDGSLDMARSIGDIDHPSISARPKLKKYDLSTLSQTEDNALILACDGLWDVVTPEMAATACHDKSPLEAAEQLKSIAFARGTCDNVTVMVIKLNKGIAEATHQ